MAADASQTVMMLLKDHAPAKINLTLRVLGRRADGYHDLESLVAFAAVCDDLDLRIGGPLALTVGGPMAGLIVPNDDNLVLKAAQAFEAHFPQARLGGFHLIKRLPVASGIGGGSSDAAAALRLLAVANDIPADHPELFEIAASLGADVPVCLSGKACLMRGVGDVINALPTIPRLFAVLVNPGAPLGTPTVFGELGLAVGQHLGEATPDAQAMAVDVTTLGRGVNDLETPAIRLRPVIGDVLKQLKQQNQCLLARMSGSGATCFGVYTDCHACAAAAEAIAAGQPGWWVVPTLIS